MKSFSAIVAVVLATALPALAQSVLDLPKCAQNDVLLAIGTSGCISTDFECICKNKSFIESLVKTIPAKCTPAETYEVTNFATVFCDSTGVKIDLPASIQSPTGAASTKAPSTSASVAPSTSVVSLTSTLSQTVVVSATPSNSVNGTVSGTPSLTRTSLTSATTAAVTTTSSPAAGAVQTAGLVGLMGAVFVGVMGL